MSSPIRQDDDLDPALRYAPRWARDRLPPLAGRPLAPPLARPVRRPEPEFSGDRAMLELQRQLILSPDTIPEPAVDDARSMRPIVLRLFGVIGFAALIAWGVISLPGPNKAGRILPPDPPAAAVAVNPGNPVKLVEVRTTTGGPTLNEGFLAMAAPAPAVLPSVAAAEPAPVPGPQALEPAPAPASPRAQPGPATTVHLDTAEIAAMVKRGKDFLLTGDLASARLLLRRAAEGGSAEAALALGATFDPLVIRRLGAIGAAPDIAQARQWYQRAADLGSAAAMGQLAKLEQQQ
jgi:hypothetical protein